MTTIVYVMNSSDAMKLLFKKVHDYFMKELFVNNKHVNVITYIGIKYIDINIHWIEEMTGEEQFLACYLSDDEKTLVPQLKALIKIL